MVADGWVLPGPVSAVSGVAVAWPALASSPVAAGLLPPGAVSSVISWRRFWANCSTSLPPTSTITPRPNWAGRPVTFIVVCMVALVASPPDSGSSVARTVAEAVPAPRVSLPEASSTITLASGSRSVNFAVPL